MKRLIPRMSLGSHFLMWTLFVFYPIFQFFWVRGTGPAFASAILVILWWLVGFEKAVRIEKNPIVKTIFYGDRDGNEP